MEYYTYFINIVISSIVAIYRKNSFKDEHIDGNHISKHLKNYNSSRQISDEIYDSKHPREYGSRSCKEYRSRGNLEHRSKSREYRSREDREYRSRSPREYKPRKDRYRHRRHYQSTSKRGLNNGELSVHDRLGYKPSVHSRISFANRIVDTQSNVETGYYYSNIKPLADNKCKFEEYDPRDDYNPREEDKVRYCNATNNENDTKDKENKNRDDDEPKEEDKPSVEDDHRNEDVNKQENIDKSRKQGDSKDEVISSCLYFKRDPTLCFNEESDAVTMATEMTKVLGETEEYIIIFG